jgi:demethoxyubiquinone hydroxylase (CLK1/Coq7/Cat5 family)
MRDIDTIDSELRLVASLRRAARERVGRLPSIDVADALLDETMRVDRAGSKCATAISQKRILTADRAAWL